LTFPSRFVRDLLLADFPFLASLAASQRPNDRRIWLRIAIDHFVATESSDSGMIAEFVEAMTAKLAVADPPTRLEIARKIAPCARAPARLLATLRALDPDASDYLLEHAVACSKGELERAIASGGRGAIAVAKRKNLDSHIVRTLASNDDVHVLVALASNDSARLEGPSLFDLLRRARRLAEQEGDRRLADALLGRGRIGSEHAALFLCAQPNQRIEILLAVQRSQLGRPPGSLAPTRSTSLDALELAAVARQPERFVALLAEALDCSLELAHAIVHDATGEPLAVALTALGAANEVVVRVLISNDLMAGSNYERIRALARLNNALNRNAAMMVIAALREDSLVSRGHKASVENTPIRSASFPASAGVAKKAGDSPLRVLRK
jgi:uncharacterized protein (DUF2336 family)